MVRGISSGARVFEYLSLKPTIRISGGGRIPYHSLTGRVDFMDISFRFPPENENMLSGLPAILNIKQLYEQSISFCASATQPDLDIRS